MKTSSLIVGVAGSIGSGKSTFTKESTTRVRQLYYSFYYDNSYKSRSDILVEASKNINYD